MFLKISPFVTTLRDNLKKVSLHKALIKQVIRKFYSDEIGDVISFSEIPGIQHLRNPRLNKGLAFSMEERQALGIHGLQPAVLRTQEEQVAICKDAIEKYEIPLNKYLFLNELRERNEKLYFRLVSENIEKLLPIIYTPTVGLVCQKFGLIYRRPRGLYITINDIGYVYNILRNWPEHTVQAIVVTDGERILGLGDLGTYGMGISIGKLSLYTALAGIKPHRCLPICLDVGTNNEKLLEDPVYIGLRQKRIRGKLYDDFLDEFMEAVVKRYGQDTLIQFEDFGTANAARLLEKYRDKYCTFNDDIQGTAAVVLAGLYATYKILGKNLSEHAFLFYGAGTAAMGIADLLVEAMLLEGSGLTEARSKIYMIDVHGLLTKSRGELFGNQTFYAKDMENQRDFIEIIHKIKPSVLIGVSTKGGAFTSEVLEAVASYHDRPIILALSNPTPNAECTPQEAFDATKGRVIFSSGSPFPDVQYGGNTFRTGQGNNSYIFPGVALGVILGGIHHIPEKYFLIAAQTIADNVVGEDLSRSIIFPRIDQIPDCSIQIAVRILEDAYRNEKATAYPEPRDKKAYVLSKLYSYFYSPSLPEKWSWPINPT